MKPRVTAAGRLAQQQVAQHALEREVAEPDLVDERRRRGPEQVCAQRAEREALDAIRVARVFGGDVPLVDEPEEDGERLEQVRAVLRVRGGELDEREVAQPVEAVAAFVLRGARRQDAELGRCLRVEQEEDAVQEAQRLLGERLRLGRRQRIELARRTSPRRPRWR